MKINKCLNEIENVKHDLCPCIMLFHTNKFRHSKSANHHGKLPKNKFAFSLKRHQNAKNMYTAVAQ